MGNRLLSVISVYILILFLFFSCDITRSAEDDLSSRIAELKELQSFSVPGAVNGLSRDCIGVLNGENIYIGLPYGTTLPSTVFIDFSFLGVRVSPASNPFLTLVPGLSQLTLPPSPASVGIDVWSRDGNFRRYYLHTSIKPQSTISFNILPADIVGPVNDPASRTNGPVSIDVDFMPLGSILDSSITSGDFAVYNSSVSNKVIIISSVSYSFDVNSGVSGPFSVYLKDSSVSDLSLGVGAEASNILSLTWDLDAPYNVYGDYGIWAQAISPDVISIAWLPTIDNYAPIGALEYKIVRCRTAAFLGDITGINGVNTTTDLNVAAPGNSGYVQDWAPMPDNSAVPLTFLDNNGGAADLDNATEYFYNIYVRDDLGNIREYGAMGFITQLEGSFSIGLSSIPNNPAVVFTSGYQVIANNFLTVDISDSRTFSQVSWSLDGYDLGVTTPHLDLLCSNANFAARTGNIVPFLGTHVLTCYVRDLNGVEHSTEIIFEVGN